MARKNSFDFVRFFAAATVLIAHHYTISGDKIPTLFGEDLAGYALNIFFSLSGFLIFQSLDRSSDWRSFVSARITRIVPTLVVALVFTSVATLVWFSNYAHAGDHLKYVYRNLFLIFRRISDFIPGVFESGPRHELNTPLWSMAYEIWLYFALFTISLLPRRFWAPIILIICIILSATWTLLGVNDALIPGTPIFPMRLGRMGCFFFSGSLLAAFWHRLGTTPLLLGMSGLAIFIVLSSIVPPTYITHALPFAAAVIGLGHSGAMIWFSRAGDPSYGMYVFAWPIQQFSYIITGDFWSSLILAFAATVATGYSTWHLYEKRCIAKRKWLAGILEPTRRSAASA